MFDLDMNAIRESAGTRWLMANPANPANSGDEVANQLVIDPEISQEPTELATVATLAISHRVSQESAELLTARLIAAAMRSCDFHGDEAVARAQMRQDCRDTPVHLQAELLDYFNAAYPPMGGSSRPRRSKAEDKFCQPLKGRRDAQ